MTPRTDPRLGRHLEHDPRSRNFPAPAADVHTVTHRHYGKVLDQGQLGSCTGHALVDALNCAPLHRNGTTYREADAVKAYGLATHLDAIAGTWPPDDTGSSGLAAAKAARQLGWITGYTHAFGLNHCLAAATIAPVMIGIPWYDGMFSPDADGTLHPTGSVAGGHELALIGIDTAHRRVTLLNSWGESWGHRGRAFLSFDDLGTLLAQHGDVTALTVAD